MIEHIILGVSLSINVFGLIAFLIITGMAR